MDKVIDVLNRFNSVNYHYENFPTTEEAGNAINFCMKIKNKCDKIEKILSEPDVVENCRRCKFIDMEKVLQTVPLEYECSKQKKVLVSLVDTTNCELFSPTKYTANVKFKIPYDLPKEIKKRFVDNFAGQTVYDGSGWSEFCSWDGFNHSVKKEVSFYDVFPHYSKNYKD